MNVVRAAQAWGEGRLSSANGPAGPFRQERDLRDVQHRPWPLPREPWTMGQVWVDLLFAHWSLPASALEPLVPGELALDTFDGRAWIGVVPFRIEGLRFRGTRPAPGLASFPEINVRTYVTVNGRPGVYFFSLDAGSWPAVLAARATYRLPYFRSRIETGRKNQSWSFRSRRISPVGHAAAFAAGYGPCGDPLPVTDGSLERWLAERYCLYTLDRRRRVYRAEIHHPPWPLQKAWAEFGENTMTAPLGLKLEGEPLLHFSTRQDAALWPIRRVDRD